MSNLDVMYSSKTEEWATPQAFFDTLNAVFHFTLDPCATPDNTKKETYPSALYKILLKAKEREACNHKSIIS